MFQYLNDVQKKRLFNGIWVAVILLGVFLALQSLNTLKEFSYIGSGVTATNIITVSGKGSVFSVPDTGSFSFSVTEDGKTVKEAQDKESTKINAIIDAVKGMGVDEKDIQTVGYNSNPTYEYSNSACPASPPSSGGVYTPVYCPPGKQVLTGYEVSQTISVKIRKTDTAGDILTKVGSLGATNISGLDFVTDDIDSVQAEARDKAIQDAKAKAKVLAKSLGVSLVRIVSFNENGNYPGPIMYAMAAGKTVSMDASVPPQVPVGQNEIVSNVTITYEVR